MAFVAGYAVIVVPKKFADEDVVFIVDGNNVNLAGDSVETTVVFPRGDVIMMVVGCLEVVGNAEEVGMVENWNCVADNLNDPDPDSSFAVV